MQINAAHTGISGRAALQSVILWRVGDSEAATAPDKTLKTIWPLDLFDSNAEAAGANYSYICVIYHMSCVEGCMFLKRQKKI